MFRSGIYWSCSLLWFEEVGLAPPSPDASHIFSGILGRGTTQWIRVKELHASVWSRHRLIIVQNQAKRHGMFLTPWYVLKWPMPMSFKEVRLLVNGPPHPPMSSRAEKIPPSSNPKVLRGKGCHASKWLLQRQGSGRTWQKSTVHVYWGRCLIQNLPYIYSIF